MVENTVEEVVAEVALMDLGALAELATKPVYTSFSNAKKLYEHTVEEARELVKVRDQNKVKKDGVVALGLNLGRNLLPLDKIKAKTTRLVCADAQVESVTASLVKFVKDGMFDEEIAVSLAQTKATAEKMAVAANAKNEVDASVPIEGSDIEGLEIEAIGVEDTGADIEQL
jgi:hypothetical protein